MEGGSTECLPVRKPVIVGRHGLYVGTYATCGGYYDDGEPLSKMHLQQALIATVNHPEIRKTCPGAMQEVYHHLSVWFPLLGQPPAACETSMAGLSKIQTAKPAQIRICSLNSHMADILSLAVSICAVSKASEARRRSRLAEIRPSTDDGGCASENRRWSEGAAGAVWSARMRSACLQLPACQQGKGRAGQVEPASGGRQLWSSFDGTYNPMGKGKAWQRDGARLEPHGVDRGAGTGVGTGSKRFDAWWWAGVGHGFFARICMAFSVAYSEAFGLLRSVSVHRLTVCASSLLVIGHRVPPLGDMSHIIFQCA